MRFLFLSLVLIVSPNLFAKVICSAFCVTISDRPEMRTKSTYKIHFSNQVDGTTSAEVEKNVQNLLCSEQKQCFYYHTRPFN